MPNTMTVQRCIDIIREAIAKHTKPEIFNTNQGGQFTSDVFLVLRTHEQIQISMGGKGRAIDNIFIERFWCSDRYEYRYLNPSNGGIALFKGTTEYIRLYNHGLIHEDLNYHTPADLHYRQKAAFNPAKYSAMLV